MHAPELRAPLARRSLAAGVALAVAGCESLTGSLGEEDRLQVESRARRRWSCRRTSRRRSTTTATTSRRRRVSPRSDATRAARRRRHRAQRQRRRADRPRAAPSAGSSCRATPEQAWNIVRQFWIETRLRARGRAAERSASWRPTGPRTAPSMPPDFLRDSIGKVADVFYTTYKRDKFRTRLERGTEPGHDRDLRVACAGIEQVPTTMIDKVSPAGFAWAVMPPNPGLEAEMLTRLMVKFGTPEAPAARRRRRRPSTPGAVPSARASTRRADGTDAARRRRQLRPRLAPRRPRARPHRLHRRRPRPLEGPVLRPLRRPGTPAPRRTRASSTSSCSGRTDVEKAGAVPDPRRRMRRRRSPSGDACRTRTATPAHERDRRRRSSRCCATSSK